jgi:protein phosphatase
MPPPPRRRRALRIAAALAVAALVIGGAIFLARQVYFLGTDDDGRVALFRGLPYELPLGIDLYSEQYSIGVEAASLSPERQDVITEHQLRDKDDAVDLVDDIEQNEGSRPAPAEPQPKQPDRKRRPAQQQQGAGQAQQDGAGTP